MLKGLVIGESKRESHERKSKEERDKERDGDRERDRERHKHSDREKHDKDRNKQKQKDHTDKEKKQRDKSKDRHRKQRDKYNPSKHSDSDADSSSNSDKQSSNVSSSLIRDSWMTSPSSFDLKLTNSTAREKSSLSSLEKNSFAVPSSSTGKRKSRSRSPKTPRHDEYHFNNNETIKVSFLAADDKDLKVRESTHKAGNWRDRVTNTPRELVITPTSSKCPSIAENDNEILGDNNIVILSHLDDKGRLRSKKPDDNSLKSMLEKERLMDADEQEMQLTNVVLKNKALLGRDTDDQFDAANDSLFESKTKDHKQLEANKLQQQISQDKKMKKILDSCWFCYSSSARKETKHLIISLGEHVYLALTTEKPMVQFQCQIVTMEHTSSITDMNEEQINEIKRFKDSLVKVFAKLHHGCIFLETTQSLSAKKHTWIDCIPVPRDNFLDSPIYFKKALLECDEEWATHKKIIDTRGGKNICSMIPRGFPYFHVEFGLDGGFAHVIEDRGQFPSQFGKSVICGILEEPAEIILRFKQQSKEEDWKRVKEFLIIWKEFDWTIELD